MEKLVNSENQKEYFLLIFIFYKGLPVFFFLILNILLQFGK